MGDLFDDQLIVGFTLFSLPENPLRMLFHVFDVPLGTAVLLICEGDRKAGFNFLGGIHIIHDCIVGWFRVAYLHFCATKPQ